MKKFINKYTDNWDEYVKYEVSNLPINELRERKLKRVLNNIR